jgi:hypothetical protein
MEFDEPSADSIYHSMREAAAAARRTEADLSDESLRAVLESFSQVTPPASSVMTTELVTISSLYSSPTARSRKPGNILLNWRKLVDIVPDVSLAGLGAATLPIAPAWSAILAGLYIWNKIWRGSVEEFSDAEAIAILALWKNRNSEKRISEEDGFDRTNALRTTYSLPPLTLVQFRSVVDRLVQIDCIEIEGGVIWLREWIRVDLP